MHVRPTKIHSVWSGPSLGAFWLPKGAKFLHADNEVSNQIARMQMVI